MTDEQDDGLIHFLHEEVTTQEKWEKQKRKLSKKVASLEKRLEAAEGLDDSGRSEFYYPEAKAPLLQDEVFKMGLTVGFFIGFTMACFFGWCLRNST